MKKIISITLSVILCLISINVFANESKSTELTIPKTAMGYLYDDAGNKFAVEGHLVETNIINNNSEYNKSATYEYELYATNHTLTTDDTDGSVSVRAYLTIYYSTQNTPTEYLLTKVTGKWNILDSRVTVTNVDLTYGCSDVFTGVTQSKTQTGISNNFSYNTGFTKYVPDEGDFTSVGANITMDLKMGSQRTWTFTLQNNIL